MIVALAGTGALPCWIRLALCATAAGNAAVAFCVPIWPPGALAPAAALDAAGFTSGAAGFSVPAGAGRLMTLLITVVLWMLL